MSNGPQDEIPLIAQGPRTTRRAALLALIGMPLAACGRKGPPELPEDADPKAPRRYPTRGY